MVTTTEVTVTVTVPAAGTGTGTGVVGPTASGGLKRRMEGRGMEMRGLGGEERRERGFWS